MLRESSNSFISSTHYSFRSRYFDLLLKFFLLNPHVHTMIAARQLLSLSLSTISYSYSDILILYLICPVFLKFDHASRNLWSKLNQWNYKLWFPIFWLSQSLLWGSHCFLLPSMIIKAARRFLIFFIRAISE